MNRALVATDDGRHPSFPLTEPDKAGGASFLFSALNLWFCLLCHLHLSPLSYLLDAVEWGGANWVEQGDGDVLVVEDGPVGARE